MTPLWLRRRQNGSVAPENVHYILLPGVGPGKTPAEGTWADVLEAIPYFLMEGGPIPPRHLVNDVLRLGVVDAGMSGGCEWGPVELDEEGYAAVVADLLARPPRQIAWNSEDLQEVGPYRDLPPPAWVHNHTDFVFWSVEVSRGLPGLTHRTLRRKVSDLLTRAGEAARRGDGREQARLEAEVAEAEKEVSALWDRDRWKMGRGDGPRSGLQ